MTLNVVILVIVLEFLQSKAHDGFILIFFVTEHDFGQIDSLNIFNY